MKDETKNNLRILGLLLIGIFLIVISVATIFENGISTLISKLNGMINSFFQNLGLLLTNTGGFWTFLQGMGTIVAVAVFINELKTWRIANIVTKSKEFEEKERFHNSIEPNIILKSLDLKVEENTKLNLNLDVIRFNDGIEKMTIDYAKYTENDSAPIAYIYNTGGSAAYDISVFSSKVKPIPNSKLKGTLDFTKKYERHEEDLIPSLYPNEGLIWGIEFDDKSIFKPSFNCKIGFLVYYRDRFKYNFFKKLFLIEFVKVDLKVNPENNKAKIISIISEIVLRENNLVSEGVYSNDTFDEIIIPTKLELYMDERVK